MAAKRKAISKKVRFEVFKRDNFSCQYCGKAAPQVILHVDHINPVSKGGDNHILNLVTSCADCNHGKSATKLDDQSCLMKQRKQIAEMNERGQQLKMMADWRRAVMKMEGQELDLLVEEVEHKLGGVEITDNGRAELKTLLKRHGYTTILEAIDRSVERYADWRDGQATSASIRHVFSGFDKIARYSKLPKTVQDAHYCRGILKNRLPDHVTPGSDRWAQCLTVLELALEYYPSREIKEFCKEVSDWAEWVDGMDAMIGIAETRDA